VVKFVPFYRVGQIKRGQCSFFRRSKARFREFFIILAGEITVHLHFEKHKTRLHYKS